MNEPSTLSLAWLAGALLGAIFYGGLWWTVQKGVSAKQPAFWFLGSLMLRTCVTLAGFYFAASGRWERLLSCLLGFVMASVVVTRMTRPRTEREASRATYSR